MSLSIVIPTYKLYGEQEHWPTPDMVHCESIAARSTLHNWQIRPHQHNDLFQILYLKGGDARIHLDATQQDMHAGQILMVPQMCIHGFKFNRDAMGHVVTMAYPLMKRLTRQAGDGLVALTAPRMHTLGDDEESNSIDAAFAALDNEYKSNASHRNLLIEFLLGSILIRLARRSPRHVPDPRQNATKANEHFGKFTELIDEHYQKQHPVSFYAQLLGITPAHLNAICRQSVAKSALELIHERMLLEAKRNLIYTSMTISVVAYTIGFSDPAYFTRFFKRMAGLSPKDFRSQAGQ